LPVHTATHFPFHTFTAPTAAMVFNRRSIFGRRFLVDLPKCVANSPPFEGHPPLK